MESRAWEPRSSLRNPVGIVLFVYGARLFTVVVLDQPIREIGAVGVELSDGFVLVLEKYPAAGCRRRLAEGPEAEAAEPLPALVAY